MSNVAERIEPIEAPESEGSGVRRRSDRTSPLWQLLLRDSPELADMTDDEVRVLVAKSKGAGPFYSHDSVMAELRERLAK